jgi:hypothetical protein
MKSTVNEVLRLVRQHTARGLADQLRSMRGGGAAGGGAPVAGLATGVDLSFFLSAGGGVMELRRTAGYQSIFVACRRSCPRDVAEAGMAGRRGGRSGLTCVCKRIKRCVNRGRDR